MTITPMNLPEPGDGDRTEPLVSIAEVARLLGVDVRHVRRLVFEGRIPYYKWGHLLRFDPAEVREWLRQFQHRPRRRA